MYTTLNDKECFCSQLWEVLGTKWDYEARSCTRFLFLAVMVYEDLIGIEMDDIDYLMVVYKCLLDNSRTGFLVERYMGSDYTEYCYSCFDASEGVSHNLSLLEMDKRDEMKKDSYLVVMS